MRINHACLFLFVMLIGACTSCLASPACEGKFINPLTDICWSCMFPMTIGDIKLASEGPQKNAAPSLSTAHGREGRLGRGLLSDTKNPKRPLCVCPGTVLPRIGLSLGFWEPIALVDVTRTPFCMVNLGGLQVFNPGNKQHGISRPGHLKAEGGDYHVHWYHYPLLAWLNILTDSACVDTADFDIAYFSELDPTWSDEALAALLAPESLVLATPAAQAACMTDSIKANTGLPLDSLFWCAGSHGSLYPMTRRIKGHMSMPQASILAAERVAFKLHRLMLLSDSKGEDGPALCTSHYNTFLPKSRYRYQMTNPKPTPQLCQPFGASTVFWESEHTYPVMGEHMGYAIWRKRNCCAL